MAPSPTIQTIAHGNPLPDVPSVTVFGTNATDIITPTQTVAGQPLPGLEDDTLYGYSGRDHLDGGVAATPCMATPATTPVTTSTISATLLCRACGQR